MLRAHMRIELDLFVRGGLSVGALARSTIETLLVLGLSVGLLTLFREHVSRQLAHMKMKKLIG